MGRPTAETEKPKLEWKVEHLYWGNATYPSETTYRTSGERLQVCVEMQMSLKKNRTREYITKADYVVGYGINVLDFLRMYQDCVFTVTDGYESDKNQYDEPRLWLTGWKELATPEERTQYEKDKEEFAKIWAPHK